MGGLDRVVFIWARLENTRAHRFVRRLLKTIQKRHGLKQPCRPRLVQKLGMVCSSIQPNRPFPSWLVQSLHVSDLDPSCKVTVQTQRMPEVIMVPSASWTIKCARSPSSTSSEPFAITVFPSCPRQSIWTVERNETIEKHLLVSQTNQATNSPDNSAVCASWLQIASAPSSPPKAYRGEDFKGLL